MARFLTGLGGHPRGAAARAAIALVVAVSLLGAPPAAAPVAAADAGWYDGGLQYSRVTDCFSIIGGYPYMTNGAGVYTGYYADPTAGIPAVGQVYYVHVVFYGIGNPCAGQYAVPEIALPSNTTLAIDATHPIVCYGTAGGDWLRDTTSCPTTPKASAWHPGALLFLPRTGEAAWPLPAGAGWEIQVPVKSSTVLVNASMNANVRILDGESSPWLTPWQGVYVWNAATVSIMYASPAADPVGRTTATTTAFVTSAYKPGTVHYQIGTTTAYTTGHQTDPLPDTDPSWKVWWDWTGLQPDTLYHFRIWFQPTVGSAVYGADQTFRTLPVATSLGVTGISSGVAGGTKSSATVTAKDAVNAKATGYRGTIHFTSSDANAGLPADYTFTAADAGAHTFTNGVTLRTMGTQWVRATDTATGSITGAQAGIVVTSTDAPLTATLTRPATPTRAATLSYALAFSEPVTELAAADLTRTGTATGCAVGAPTGSGASFTVPVTGCGTGTVTLALKAGSVKDAAANAGPAAAVIAGTVTVDRTAPTTSALAAAPRTGAALSGTSIPLTLRWSGGDNSGGSGVARYELAQSRNGGTWASVSTSLAAKSASVTSPSSGTVRYRVRAVDAVGNAGPWTYGPILTPRLVQQTSTAVTYTGTWTSASSSAYSGGSAKYASVAGRSASYTFTGRSIALVTTQAPSRGKVRVYVNGSLVATVDLYRASAQDRALAWQKTWSSSGTRTIKIVVVGTSGRPRVDLDAFVVVK